MDKQSLDLIARYDAVEVPATLRTMDANDERFWMTREVFFEDVMTSLRLSRAAISAFMRTEHRMLVPPAASRGSDDFVDELQLSGVQTLASVLRVRDDPNFQVAHFAKYPLLPQTINLLSRIRD